MTVQELIEELRGLPPQLPVCIDDEDGLRGNFQDVTRVVVRTHLNGDFAVVE